MHIYGIYEGGGEIEMKIGYPKIKTKVLLISFLFIQLVVGCATTSQKISSIEYVPTKPVDIVVLYKEPVREYEIIGYVRALQKTIWEKTDSLLQRCREEAAKFGADAIIVTNIGNESSMPGMSVNAKAIKWKESLR